MISRKRIIGPIILAVFFVFFGSLSAMVEVSGIIYNDTTWTNTDTILVTDTVTIASSAQLTIQPGTTILFNLYPTTLRIDGQLLAEGEETEKIMFTSITDTSGGTPYPGSWTGLYFFLNSSGILRHCQIRYAFHGVQTVAAPVEFYDCLVENFLVRGFYIDGVLSNPHTPTIMERCVARQEGTGGGTGIYIYRMADVYISRCRVYNCLVGMDFSAFTSAFPRFNVVNCDIRDNLIYGIQVQNCGT